MLDDIGVVRFCMMTVVLSIMYTLYSFIFVVFNGYCEFNRTFIYIGSNNSEFGFKGLLIKSILYLLIAKQYNTFSTLVRAVGAEQIMTESGKLRRGL